jgi:hypothetical protein
MKTYSQAILAHIPNAEFSVTETGTILEWHGDNQPTDAQVQQWYAEYQEPVVETVNPIEKLKAFLDANPDVKAILQ